MWIIVTWLSSYFPVYALLDPRSTLSMVTPFVANQSDLLPKVLQEPFLVSTPIGDSIKAEGICREIDGIVASPVEIKLSVISLNLKANKMLSKRLDILLLSLVDV